MNKSDLRARINEKRRSLSLDFQRIASESICAILKEHPAIRCARTIATYYAIQGEANPFPLVQQLDKQWLLPVINNDKITFVTFSKNKKLLRKNCGIPEPDENQPAIAIEAIDVILLPLVGFDCGGNRVGRGAGHYDRALALTQNTTTNKPWLIGIAYEFQKIDKINADPWDIPLDEIATEKKIYTNQNSAFTTE